MGTATADRIRTVFEDFEQVMKEFLHRHHITHEEYRAVTDFMIESVRAGEESLLPDVFFEAVATDEGTRDRPGTREAIEGPFYLPGAPVLRAPYVMPQRPDEAGEVLVFSGSVRSENGRPLAGAEIDMWQADAAGRYSNIHPGIPDFNLRGRFRTDAEGRFEVRTIVPPPYEIPKDGPTGRLLEALGRHCFRPAHLHVRVTSPGHTGLTTQIFFEGDKWLDSDVAGSVRDGLVIALERHDRGDTTGAGARLDGPYVAASFDFVLAAEAGRAA